jgi:hypothetical protein
MLWILATLSIAQAGTGNMQVPQTQAVTPQVLKLDKDAAAKWLQVHRNNDALRTGELRFDPHQHGLQDGLVDPGFGRDIAGRGLEMTWTIGRGGPRNADRGHIQGVE